MVVRTSGGVEPLGIGGEGLCPALIAHGHSLPGPRDWCSAFRGLTHDPSMTPALNTHGGVHPHYVRNLADNGKVNPRGTIETEGRTLLRNLAALLGPGV